jgi:UDP-2,4-diacetamido-2,4,6-trideoxy-beta-L-altropyranose hydrolase
MKADFDCHFFIRSPLPEIVKEIEESGAVIHILKDDQSYPEEAKRLSNTLSGQEIVVLDGYQFDTSYQLQIKSKGSKLVCIDDIFSFHFAADVIINHAGGLDKKDYSREPFSKLCLGPEFAILRRPFWNSRKPGPGEKKEEIFVCLGGADVNNDTVKILELLEEKKVHLLCNVVVGAAYPHIDDLLTLSASSSLNIQVVRAANVEQIIGLMRTCNYAICAPSTVSYEYLTTGGELYTQLTADNQQHVFRFFRETGLGFLAEEFPVLEQDRIIHSKKQQDFYFDGKSHLRLRKIFSSLSNEYMFGIRRAKETDRELLFQWVNEKEVRKSSLNSALISFSDHSSWFSEKLNSDRSYIYIIEREGNNVGQARFDLDENGHTAFIDYSIAREHRGNGWAEPLMRVSCRSFLNDHRRPISLAAIVKTENMASCRVFEQLDFVAEEKVEQGQRCYIYKL